MLPWCLDFTSKKAIVVDSTNYRVWIWMFKALGISGVLRWHAKSFGVWRIVWNSYHDSSTLIYHSVAVLNFEWVVNLLLPLTDVGSNPAGRCNSFSLSFFLPLAITAYLTTSFSLSLSPSSQIPQLFHQSRIHNIVPLDVSIISRNKVVPKKANNSKKPLACISFGSLMSCRLITSKRGINKKSF
jgi:hypothetical protein